MSDNTNSNLPPTSNSVTLPPQEPQEQQQQQQQHNSRSSHHKNETPEQWLSRVREIQLNRLTPQQRDEMVQRANRSQTQRQHAKQLHAVSHRASCAKTTTWVSMSNSAQPMLSMQAQAPPAPGAAFGSVASMPSQQPQQPQSSAGGFFSSFFGGGSSNNNNNNNNAPALPSLPTSSATGTIARRRHAEALQSRGCALDNVTEQTAALMDVMEEDDDAIAASYAPVLNSAAMPVSAAREEEQMHTANVGSAYDYHSRQAEVVTQTEEQQALAGLRTEPRTDAECAAKFVIFEKFSDRVSKIRKDLQMLFDGTVSELPPMVADKCKQQYKQLDSDRCRGVQDGGKYWVVHDMMVQVTRNSDMMQQISDEVARVTRLCASSSDPACPICLEEFTDGQTRTNNNNGDDNNDGDEAPRVERLVLSCCHSVCEVCWEQMRALNARNGFPIMCPLCRGSVFVEELQQRQ